ncbi:uncharacterized protein LOC124491860 [Dermatophagoides farinae]|uniref:Uncharacterized protein n=1 Tax=Dermatophagoides farinae TaxID=6954 RepID=A0A9D4P147_DERFA|nr:uncharacterized protein LOC124491860 [Dermatophagoides farinae]KAH7642028.1 hypothetical protein HUG17_5073 [Dermatophagoides farinae]
MPVVLIATDRTWTSVNATELNDHILNDGIFEGPTFITRDEFGIPPDETFLYKSLNVHLVREQTYSTNLKAATVLSRFVSHGYRIVASAGSGVGTSGKARYSADVAVTDYRWLWTLVRDDMAPPPYPSISSNKVSLSQTREKPSYSSSGDNVDQTINGNCGSSSCFRN